jgi:hypothetical protein
MRSIVSRAASIFPRLLLIILALSSFVPSAQAGIWDDGHKPVVKPDTQRGGTSDDGQKPVLKPENQKSGTWDDGLKPAVKPDNKTGTIWDDGHKPAPGLKPPAPK